MRRVKFIYRKKNSLFKGILGFYKISGLTQGISAAQKRIRFLSFSLNICIWLILPCFLFIMAALPINQEQKKQLGFVQASSTHLMELINDVLDISKIEAEQMEIIPDKFHLEKTITKVVQLVTPLANKKKLPIHVHVDLDNDEVFNDQRRVEQVIINLLNNAIKFTETGYIELICQQIKNNIQISICDTGIGIRPEQEMRIFKPFHQLDNGLTRKYEGTGLGLSISMKLVEKMGGSMVLVSQGDDKEPPNRPQGVGCTFTIIIPRYFAGVA